MDWEEYYQLISSIYGYMILLYLLGRFIPVLARHPQPENYHEVICPGQCHEFGSRHLGTKLAWIRVAVVPGYLQLEIFLQGSQFGLLLGLLVYMLDATLGLLTLIVVEMGRLKYEFQLPLPAEVTQVLLVPADPPPAPAA